MILAIDEVDELVSIVCDKLCKHVEECVSQEELEDRCESCPLVERLIKEVNGGTRE